MSSRRRFIGHGLQAGAGLATVHLAAALAAQQAPQQTRPPAAAPDEMTLNSAPKDKVYSHYDFGPLPAQLPAEAVALRGRNSLRAHGERRGVFAGAALTAKSLQPDPALQQLVADQYGILVPEGELKWRALRPAPDKFDFTGSDYFFDFAAQHRLQMRGHTLAWHNSVPDWLWRKASSFNVRQLFVEHIRAVMGRYKGRVHSWDVVNEAILPKDGQPGALRKSFWYDAVGSDYVDLAFRTAREADPHARLTYNDYGVEYDSEEDAERRAKILDLVRGMLDRKVPLDAVGIQSHIKAASQYTVGKGLRDYIESLRALGLEVYLTELDVNEDDIAENDVAQRDATIAQTYRQFLDVALGDPAVKLMLTWGVSDRRTWLNDGPTHHRKQPGRPQRSLPFDKDYRPKPAFFAVRDGIDAHKG